MIEISPRKIKQGNWTIQPYWWHCGDDVCDCHQIRIVRFERPDNSFNRFAEDIYSGPFYSQPAGSELDHLYREWSAACRFIDAIYDCLQRTETNADQT